MQSNGYTADDLAAAFARLRGRTVKVNVFLHGRKVGQVVMTRDDLTIGADDAIEGVSYAIAE